MVVSAAAIGGLMVPRWTSNQKVSALKGSNPVTVILRASVPVDFFLIFKIKTCATSFFEMFFSTLLAIRECRVGFPCFLLVNLALSRFLCKNHCLVKPDFSHFSKYKHKQYIIFGQKMIISANLPITINSTSILVIFVKFKTQA